MAPIPRCCAVHADWPTLVQHLLNDFPNATISQVVREVRQAREQIDQLGLADSDARLMAELTARHRLLGLDRASDSAAAIRLPDY
jgi:CRP-like cAMP-binding protein